MTHDVYPRVYHLVWHWRNNDYFDYGILDQEASKIDLDLVNLAYILPWLFGYFLQRVRLFDMAGLAVYYNYTTRDQVRQTSLAHSVSDDFEFELVRRHGKPDIGSISLDIGSIS